MGLSSALVLALTAGLAAGAVSIPENTVKTCPASGAVTAAFAEDLTASSFRTSDGREVRLADVIGPGEDGQVISAEQQAAARAALRSELLGHRLSLAVSGSPDRYRRITVQVFADGVWVQEAMVRAGLLRVAPQRQSPACTGAVLTAENAAIAAGAGHWGDRRFQLRTPDQLSRSAGRFETVEGEIWSARRVEGREVIEFANASSFQVIVLPDAAKALRDDGTNFRRLRGRILRVRGWLKLDERPTMEISAPEGLQVFGKARRRN